MMTLTTESVLPNGATRRIVTEALTSEVLLERAFNLSRQGSLQDFLARVVLSELSEELEAALRAEAVEAEGKS